MTIDFMIIGAQKASTSSLHRALREQPRIYMPDGESPLFEDPEFAAGTWRNLRSPTAGSAVGIKRPDNLCRLDIMDRIASTLPGARFIAVLRDPIARAVSAYFHLVRHGHLPLAPLDVGLSRAIAAHATGEDTALSSVISYGLYGTFLGHWYDRYDRDRFLVFSQTQVSRDLSATLVRSCRHLGVHIADDFVRPGLSENVGLYDPRWIRLDRAGHLLSTRAGTDNRRRFVRTNRVWRTAGAAASFVATKASRQVPAPRPAPSVLERLHAVYAPDLAKLRDLVPPQAIDWTLAPLPFSE